MAFTKAGLWGPQAIIDATGHPLPGATATLYLTDEVTLASLWTTSAKSVAAPNPAQADIHANLHFYADPGQYRLRVNVGTVVTWLDVEVPIDPGEAAQDQDVVAAQAAAEAYADGIVAAALAASQPLDADLTAIAALATTAFGQALLILADAAALRTAAGLGTAATHAVGDFDAAGTAAAAVGAVVAGAPGALDTLNELATALADDANFATTVTNALATKAIAGATSGTANQAALPAAVAHTHEIVKTDDGGVYLSTGSSWVEVVPPSLKLAPTAVKTGNYTAAVGDYVQCDTSGGIFTVTLPTAPADKTSIAVDLIASGNTLTIARGGTDVFQKAGGPTSLTMNTANRVLVLQYQSSIAVWHVQDHLPAVISTKGDLLTYGTERARLAVGADGALLGADSTQTTGLKWIPSGTYAPRHAMGPSGFWLPGGNPFTTTPVIGIDPVNDLMWFVGSTSIKQVTSLGTVISTDKTQPAGIVSQTAKKMLTFKGNHYLAAADLTGAGSTALAGIWQAPPAAGSTAFTWTKVASASAGSQGDIGPAFNKIVDANGNDLALLWAEYSDPTNGPSMWRSTDGTTWTRVIQITDASMRHFHCVIQDPYNPAVIYATGGDGVSKPIWRSTDFGATWAVIITDSNWQAVQISFSTNWIWFAGDSSRDSVFVMDRATLTPRMASTNHHRYIAVPHPLPRPGGHVFADGVTGNNSKTFTSATAAFVAADVGRLVMCQNVPVDTIISAVGSGTSITMSQAATAAGSALSFTLGGDEFYRSGFYGIVDPATEIFYFTANDSTSGGNTSGLFMLPYVGGRIELVESFYAITNVANGQVSAEHFIYNNKLWMAGKNHLLAAFIAAA